jgi:hypothetical protein
LIFSIQAIPNEAHKVQQRSLAQILVVKNKKYNYQQRKLYHVTNYEFQGLFFVYAMWFVFPGPQVEKLFWHLQKQQKF